MNRKSVFLALFWGLSCAGTTALGAGDWRLSAGPIWRGGMDMKASGSSHAQDQGVRPTPGAVSRERRYWLRPACMCVPDNGSYYSDRDFLNGFVYMDPSTQQNGDTWYWGYQDAEQYDAAAGTLTFNRSSRQEAPSYAEHVREFVHRDAPLSASDALSGAGLGLAFERDLVPERLGVAFGVNAVWGIAGSVKASTLEASATREWVEYADEERTDSTYTYDLMGVVPPAAPYAGTYGGPGPLLPNLPASVTRQETVVPGEGSVRSRSGSRGHNRVDIRTDAALYELWLGPALAVRAGSRVRLGVRPQVSLNLVDASAERHESWMEAGSDGE